MSMLGGLFGLSNLGTYTTPHTNTNWKKGVFSWKKSILKKELKSNKKELKSNIQLEHGIWKKELFSWKKNYSLAKIKRII